MIDIGANLSHESFEDDLDQVIDRALMAGLQNIIVTGTTVEGSKQALALATRYPDTLFSTAGVHPHDAAEFTADSIDDLRLLASDPKVVAIGESGLDFNRNYSPQENQREAFAAQLDLAIELGLPVFLHQRDAHQAFMEILEPRLSQLSKVVVHCFTGETEELQDYLAHDLYIGITGWVCDERRGHHLHPLIPLIPPDRLLIETDAPYLLPRTIRPKPKGRRNEPVHLPWVVKTIAECLNQDPEEIATQTTLNAREFFALTQE